MRRRLCRRRLLRRQSRAHRRWHSWRCRLLCGFLRRFPSADLRGGRSRTFLRRGRRNAEPWSGRGLSRRRLGKSRGLLEDLFGTSGSPPGARTWPVRAAKILAGERALATNLLRYQSKRDSSLHLPAWARRLGMTSWSKRNVRTRTKTGRGGSAAWSALRLRIGNRQRVRVLRRRDEK